MCERLKLQHKKYSRYCVIRCSNILSRVLYFSTAVWSCKFHTPGHNWTQWGSMQASIILIC